MTNPRNVILLRSFSVSLANLDQRTRNAVEEAVRHFINRTNENALRVEKKSGLEGIWAFRVDRGTRVFFVLGKDGQGRTINRLFHVGAHDDYRTVARRRPR